MYIYMIYVYIYIYLGVFYLRGLGISLGQSSPVDRQEPRRPWDGAHGVVGHYQRYQWQARPFGSTGNDQSDYSFIQFRDVANTRNLFTSFCN